MGSVLLPLLRRMTSAAVVARFMMIVLVAVFVVPAFHGACCAGVEIAAAAAIAPENDDCCAGASLKAGGETDDGNEGDVPCSCPFPCAAGCGGHLVRVLVPTNSVELAGPAPALATRVRPEFVEPTDPDPRAILHVPKPLRA